MRRTLSVLAGLLFAFGVFSTTQSTAQAQDWGTVKGKVTFGGDKAPARDPLNVNKDQDHCLSKGAILAEEWLVNQKNLGVQNVFIWLEADPNGNPIVIHPDLKAIKAKEVLIDQPCCMFVPHALAIREGQTVVVKNPAPVQHNFRWIGHPEKNPGGNSNMIPGGSIKIADLKADTFPVSIKCDIHPWMAGWVRVYDHPYFAVTDENGAFEMPKAPAGLYRLKVWHPASGWLGGVKGKAGTPITIKGGATTELDNLKIGG